MTTKLQNYNLKQFPSILKSTFLLLLVVLLACGGAEKPEDLLSPEQMTKILMEVHILESKVSELPVVPSDSKFAVFNHFEKQLFEAQNVSAEQYESSFKYYLDHPKEFEKIYNTVVDSLLQKEKLAGE
ncbi:MAG: DUF4296 domain-containing protein [Bacteroidota bacterium]